MLDALTLDQLRVLAAVAEAGSFSAAARRLGRVQSAISQSIQSLELTLGVPLFARDGKTPRLNDAGRVILNDARGLLAGAETLRARAESIAADVEPELTLAVDAMFPNAILIAALNALKSAFPSLPVTLFTEGLGAAEQRLRDGVARLGIYSPDATGVRDLDTEFLTTIRFVPVVAADHPLAAEPGLLSRDVLKRHVQLVLTDRSSLSAGMSRRIVSPRIWRFGDLRSRLDYLLAGFGWCHMPVHFVGKHIAAGRLKRLDLKEDSGLIVSVPLHVVHERGRPPNIAGRWLLDDLRRRLSRSDIGAAMEPSKSDGRIAADVPLRAPHKKADRRRVVL